MKELNLKTIKETELNILRAFDDFCKKNNLEYVLAYGTLLGCVRHKGFIPWDDDIDIFMLRKDYDKLLLLKLEFENSFKNLKFKNLGDKNYPFGFLKITDDTTRVEEKEIEPKYQYGIWIDVFPLDKISCNKKRHIRNVKTIDFWNKILVKSIIKSGNIGITKIQKLINSVFLIPLAHFIGCVFDIPKVCDKKSRLFNSENTNHVTNYIWENNPKKTVFDINKIFPSKTGSFEDFEFSVPNDTDYVLKSLYGDYMKLPPESERVSHLAKAWKI